MNIFHDARCAKYLFVDISLVRCLLPERDFAVQPFVIILVKFVFIAWILHCVATSLTSMDR